MSILGRESDIVKNHNNLQELEDNIRSVPRHVNAEPDRGAHHYMHIMEALLLGNDVVEDHDEVGDPPVSKSGVVNFLSSRLNGWVWKPVLAVAIVLMLFIGAFSVYLLKYNGKALPNVMVANQIVSGKSESEIRQLLESRLNNLGYLITIDNQTYDPDLSEIGVETDVETTTKLAMHAKRGNFLTMLDYSEPVDIKLSFDINKSQLENYINSLNLPNTDPVNATITIQNGQIITTPETVGKKVNIEKIKEHILSTSNKIDSHEISVNSETTYPKITDQIVNQTKTDIEKIVAKDLTISYPGGGYSFSNEEKLSWLNLTTNETEAKIDIQIDDSRVESSARSVIDKQIRQKKDQVVMTRPDGSQFVSTGGEVGRNVTNKAESLSTFVANFRNNGGNVVVNVEDVPFGIIDGGQIADKMVEVDLTNHMAYAWENGQVINSFAISGGKPSTPSPIGTFRIFAKTRKQTMSGPGYSTPNIEWISWFYPDYALHGAYWHNNFGIANVSHGCINFRNNDAKWVYDWAPIGTTVNVHY